MGSDKALLPFRGDPLAHALAALVERAAGSATLVGNPHLGPVIGHPAIPDLYPGEGPLGGILTALEHTQSDWNLVVACDMPGLTAEFLGSLLEAAGQLRTSALVPVSAGGRPEPLCAVYHRGARTALHRAFAGGVRKIMAALAELDICRWPVAETEVFQNVNTPEDWAPFSRYAPR